MFGVDAAFDVATGGNLGDLSIRVNTTQNLTPATPKAQTNTSQPLVPVKVNFTELVAPQMDSVLYPTRLKWQPGGHVVTSWIKPQVDQDVALRLTRAMLDPFSESRPEFRASAIVPLQRTDKTASMILSHDFAIHNTTSIMSERGAELKPLTPKPQLRPQTPGELAELMSNPSDATPTRPRKTNPDFPSEKIDWRNLMIGRTLPTLESQALLRSVTAPLSQDETFTATPAVAAIHTKVALEQDSRSLEQYARSHIEDSDISDMNFPLNQAASNNFGRLHQVNLNSIKYGLG